MTGSDPLDSLRRRALHHAFEDGAIDLVVGIFTLMVGVATQRRVFLGLALVYLLAMAMAWKWLHDGLSSRRTGYAELPDYPPKQLLSVILLAGCVTMGVVAVLTLSHGRLWSLDAWPTWTPMLSGVVLAGGFVHTALRSGLVRFHFYAAVSVGASLFFWLYPFGPRINPSDRLTLPFFVLAAVLIVVGSATIARFVRSRPIVSQEVSGDR